MNKFINSYLNKSCKILIQNQNESTAHVHFGIIIHVDSKTKTLLFKENDMQQTIALSDIIALR